MLGRLAELAGLPAAKNLPDIVKTSLAGKPYGVWTGPEFLGSHEEDCISFG